MNLLAAVGLALGGALGLAGAMVSDQNVQAILRAIDSAGIVMASALLALKYFRTGNDVVAGGFLVFAIGEGVMLSGTAAGPAGSVSAFAAVRTDFSEFSQTGEQRDELRVRRGKQGRESDETCCNQADRDEHGVKCNGPNFRIGRIDPIVPSVFTHVR